MPIGAGDGVIRGVASLSSIVCGGEGTNSITFGSGASTATLTFTGVDTSIDVTNHVQPVSLGEFRLTASEGFAFPSHPTSPKHSILRFAIRLDQTTTIESSGARAVGVWTRRPDESSDRDGRRVLRAIGRAPVR
jgi:hypothetical protein